MTNQNIIMSIGMGRKGVGRRGQGPWFLAIAAWTEQARPRAALQFFFEK